MAAPPFAGFATRLSADGTTALTAGYDGSLMFWRVAPNGVVSFLDALRLSRSVPAGADGATFTIAPNGRYFAAAHTDGELEVWDRLSLRKVFARKTAGPVYDGIAFHPRRPWLMVATPKGAQRIDLASGKTVDLAGGWPLVAVPGSDLLASPYGLIDGLTGRLVRRWKDRTANVEPIRVSPDGKLVVIGGEDPGWTPPNYAATESAYARNQTLRTWRIADGKLLRTMPGFWTMSDADRGIVWQDTRRISIPGLGLVRDAITGRTIGHTKPSGSTIERPMGSVPEVVRGPKGDRWVTLRFPDPGARVDREGFGPGRMIALHEVRTTYRDPGTWVGGGRAVTQVTPEGVRTVADPSISGGRMGFDESGAYAREILAMKSGKGTVLIELTTRPFGSSSIEVRRTLLVPGENPRVETSTIAKRAETKGLLPSGYNSFSDSLSAVRGDGFLVVQPNFGDHDTITGVDMKDGREVWTIREKDWHPNSTSIAANRDWVTFSWERYDTRQSELVLVRADTGKIAFRIPCAQVITAAFSPDGRTLALMTFDDLATVDLSESSPTVRHLTALPNPTNGDLSDPLLWWTPSGRLVAASSLRPTQIIDPATGKLLATARFFGDGSWSALRADGTVDGPARTDVRIYRDGHWTPSPHHEPFFLDLLK